MAAINKNIRWVINGKEYRYIKEMADYYNLPTYKFMNYLKLRKAPDGYFIRVITIVDRNDYPRTIK